MLGNIRELVAGFVDRLRCEAGQALAEYGLIVGLIGAVCIIAVAALGLAVWDKLDQLARCAV